MKTKHTPGPWKEDGFKITDSKGKLICRVDSEGGSDAFDMANARLIAAAPELLEGLKALADIAEDEDNYPTFTERARKAIAKATEERN